ncbi:MAG TPA: protein kinase [Kofleriaceae bacterium]|nr:protein kinase [Kofleriaceae bacterium]
MTSSTSPTERVGRYQLLDPIGIGPSGTVSRAKVFGVAGFERQFAVKRFHAELTATAAMAAMLSAAARAYGSLEHPRIARMSEFGVAQGATFTAVEYVVGLDALRLISEARLAGVTLAAGGALALVSQAARAVGYAHGRGLTHLGLAPTNVIVTADGDIKITDFGILSATLPTRPIDVARLAQRIPYLAPEQLANEATSAATDVFALGVLAYELVTGQRTFKGETPQQIASSIMAGPPGEPPLPRPIVRVLQRCLARSPFERFPDARAMADALDAALRVAPVPGTRKDIGAQVKDTLDRLAALNDGQMSGMVALHLGTGPIRTLGDGDLARAASAAPVTPAYEINSGAAPGLPPTFAAPPGSTLPDLPRQPMTVPGLAPPPIPVPPGVNGPPTSPLSGAPGSSTLLGMGSKPPAIPTIRPRPGSSGGIPTVPAMVPNIPRAATRPGTRPGTADDAIAIEPVAPQFRVAEDGVHTIEPSGLIELDGGIGEAVELDAIDDHDDFATPPPPAPPSITAPPAKPSAPAPAPAPAPDEGHGRTMIGVAVQPVEAPARSRAATDGEEAPMDTLSGMALEELRTAAAEPPVTGTLPPPEPVLGSSTGESPAIAHAWPASASDPEVPVAPPESPPAPPPGWRATPPPVSPVRNAPFSSFREPPRRSKGPLIAVLGLAAAGIAAWQIYVHVATPAPAAPGKIVATKPGPESGAHAVPVVAPPAAIDAPAVDAAPPAIDAGPVAIDARAVTVDARAVTVDAAAPPVDAGASPVDAGAATPTPTSKPPIKPAAPDASPADTLAIASTPPGAHVFLDGADAGTTPAKLAGSPDRHTMALLLAGHELYIAQVDGHGTFSVPLKEVTPSNGPAGIKVMRCKDKDRYYVFVDGKPTGQTCPTERIGCEVGPHTVEVYDVVSETRRKWDIVVKDTRLSFRVRVE